MCGIAGFFSSQVVANWDHRLAAALRLLKTRGPDDQGQEVTDLVYGQMGLGHRRLSIIDLSAGGHQPMHSADGRHSIVFNGEIYNYLELRQELTAAGRTFRSQSDTEVLLAAWSQWGPTCLPRLVGMFAFAVFDREQGTLTCARDAFGIKPFLYAAKPGQFCFASELAALVALRGEGATLNHQRVYDYLVHGDYDSGDDTFVEDIRHLPPASWMRVDIKRGIAEPPIRWWSPSLEQRCTLSFADAAAGLREIFLRNVRLQLRSDVPLGAALSGGIDSSAVVCAMRHIAPDAPIHTFSFVARGSPVSEEAWIAQVNHHVGAQAHIIEVDPHEMANDLDDMIKAQGEPFGSTSIYAQYRVFKLARDCGVTVTLDGQGADELLGGYMGYPGQRLLSLIEQGEWLRAADFLRHWAQWPDRTILRGLKMLLAQVVRPSVYQQLRALGGGETAPHWLRIDRLTERGVQPRFPNLRPAETKHGRRLTSELAWSCVKRGLPALLRHGDRNSMRFSVESRVPFLTRELAEFTFSLPEEHLVSNLGETKSVFRAAMRGLVPDKILDRRDKIGFATPEIDWLRAIRPQIRRWIAEAEEVDFLDKSHVLLELETMLDGTHKFSWQAWRWINFLRWHELVFRSMR